MKVLVIIVSYNFERWMDACLSSLQRSSHPVDILVIDNASQDCTVNRLRKEYPEIRLICNAKNLGFGQANNLGMKIALDEGYQAVFLLNQDAWIDSDCIATLCRLSEKHPTYGVLSPIHLTGNGKHLDAGFAAYTHLQDIPNDDREVVKALFINAAFWFIPTGVIRQVGMFSPLFYHYGEDKDFANRLHYHHFLIGYSPQVFGWHDRECRKVTDNEFLRSERVYLLSEYANINYSLPKAFAKSILACFKKALMAPICGKGRFCISYLSMACSLFAKTIEVYQTRKTNS